ncbi:hypothetical protein niasHS_012435 [Heterodera schachtii]|uniref:RRM domain-containing protein n=1 Tax=Heterodera schachtii TaxID=97005 RepID=A0ABD2IR80_HETSC
MSRSRSRSRSPIRRGGDRFRSDRGGDRGGGNRIDHKSDRMVYLTNLPWELSWMELKDIIREKAGEVNFVEVLEGRDGRSKGCAVVEFKRRDGAIKCVESMHRTELKDRLIIAKEIRDPIAFFRKVKEDTGIDFLGGGDRLERSRGPPSRSGGGSVSINENETFGLSPSFLRQLGISTPLCNRVFITNISYNCGVGRLFEICALAGRLTWMDLQLDKEGKSKGMAVCEYSHPIEAVQAVSMLNNQRLFDRTISVRMDRYPKEVERREGGLPFGLRAVGMGLGANGAPLTDVASVISSISPSQTQPGMNGTAGAPITPFQSPPNVAQFGPAAVQQPVQAVAAGPPSGFQQGLPDHGISGHFQSPQPTYQPQATSGFFNPPQPSPQNRPSGGMAFGGGGATPQYAPTKQMGVVGGGTASAAVYGHPPQQQTPKYEHKVEPKFEMGAYPGYGSGAAQPAMSSGATDNYQPSRVILIKNLPVDYTWQIVSDRVQQFGDLESVEMITPGVAKVRFVKLRDAEHAKAALQGTTVEGRAIGIEYL